MFQTAQQIGNYTLISKLGRGGFGEVWLAERRTKFVTTKVAVKLPLDDQVDHEAVKQEATLWEQASGHPNILPIIDADEYDGQIVIVSEYAPDGSLEQWLRTNGKMPVERAVETTIQILDGLEFLHSRDIIHRDLKPANILLQGKTPRLADFGISRALRTTVASQSQNISGTFAYMSPEALDGKRSKQTDIWSVGVNFYQFLTGTLPFPQTEPSQLLSAIMLREYTILPVNIPPNLQTVIAKALAKQPENRYASASEMSEDLKRILRGEKVSKFIHFDLPETQHSFPVKHIPPTQKSPVVYNQSTHNEVKTVLRSKTKPTIPTFLQDDPPLKSNLWVFVTIGLVLISAIGLSIYFLTNQPKRIDSNNNEAVQVNSNSNEVTQITQTQPSNNSLISENVNQLITSNVSMPTPISTPIAILDKTQVSSVVNKYISGLDQGEGEYKEGRKIIYGDLDNDGDDDVVAYFYMTMGSGAGWGSLAAFRNNEGQLKQIASLRVSGDDVELPNKVILKKITNRRILLETLKYSEDDPNCCPSIKGKTSYILNGDKLVLCKLSFFIFFVCIIDPSIMPI